MTAALVVAVDAAIAADDVADPRAALRLLLAIAAGRLAHEAGAPATSACLANITRAVEGRPRCSS